MKFRGKHYYCSENCEGAYCIYFVRSLTDKTIFFGFNCDCTFNTEPVYYTDIKRLDTNTYFDFLYYVFSTRIEYR